MPIDSMAPQISFLDAIPLGHHLEFIHHLVEVCIKCCGGGEADFRFFLDARTAECFEESTASVEIRSLPVTAKTPEEQLKFTLESSRECDGRLRLFLPRMNGYVLAIGGVKSSTRKELQPNDWSGIWFAPRSASWVHGGSLRARVGAVMEIYWLRRLRARSNLRRVYILNDPRTARFLQYWVRLPGGILPLADPVATLPQPKMSRSVLRKGYGIPDGATVFALLGALREGKGIEEALRAMSTWRVPTDRPATLLLAGEPLPDFVPKLQADLRSWEAANPAVKLVTDLRRLTAEEFSGCLSVADYLLLPYRNVYGSSGMLGHAARTGKPVIATGRGLLGDLVNGCGLGTTCNPADESDFHDALERAVLGGVSMDGNSSSNYLHDNSVESFQRTIMEGLLEP